MTPPLTRLKEASIYRNKQLKCLALNKFIFLVSFRTNQVLNIHYLSNCKGIGLNDLFSLDILNITHFSFVESQNVQVDAEGAKVRPAHTRCSTVILREIPADTQIQEIKVVFYIIKNVSSSTSLKRFGLFGNLRKFFLTHSFMNKFDKKKLYEC